jgi:hypothetical protein
MILRTFVQRSGSARAAWALAAVVAASAVSAQGNGTLPVHKRDTVTNWTSMSTYSFIPQVDENIQHRAPQERNPEYRPRIRTGQSNALVPGGIGGSTTATVGAKFPGVSFQGSYPPDPDIGVSRTHIVQVANVLIAFFDKAGNKQFQQDLGPSGFFSGLGATPFVFDPKVHFDAKANRFFVVALEVDFNAQTSHLLVAVSDDGDPNGTWNKFRIDNMVERDGDKYWLDYPGWGHNKDGVVCTGNMFPFESGNVFSQILIMNKLGLTNPSNNTLTVTRFNDDEAFTIQPTEGLEGTSNYVYGASLNTFSSIRVYAFADFLTTPTAVFTDVAVPQFSVNYQDAPSTGGRFLDTIMGRLMDAVARGNRMLAVHTTTSTLGTAQVTWYEFNMSTWPASGTPSLFQSGNVRFTDGQSWAFMPAISKNSLGDISVIFTRSSTDISADMYIASRKQSDPAGQMGVPKKLATSTGTAFDLFNRWGDYAAVEVDPIDNTTFWGNHEITLPSGFWGTEIQKWTVSTGGGGGGGGVGGTIAPASVSILEGTLVSGNLASVQNLDGNLYRVNSRKRPDGGFYSAVQNEFVSTKTASQTTSLDISAYLSIQPGRTATAQIFVWNWTTSRWVLFRSTGLTSPTQVTMTATILSGASQYVNSSKRVRTLVRVFDPVRRNGTAPTTFTQRVDTVRLGVTASS